jgi:cytochrome P450
MRTVSHSTAPGPRGLPFVGSVFPAWRDPLSLFLGARATYGDVVHFRFGPYDYYLVTDPDAIRHVLVDNAKAYTKSRNYLGLRVVLGDGLLTSEGEHWRRQRKLTQPAFHRSRLAGFADQMTRATRDLLGRWESEQGDGPGSAAPFDVHREMMRLTFRIVGLTLFSSDVDGDAQEVGQALDVAMHWANEYAESFVRVPPWVPTPANVRFKKAMKTLDEIVYRLIATRRKEPADDLLGMLIASKGEDGEPGMDDRQLRDEVITMVLAGHETTANLLTWTFYLLSKHPEIEARVREEARRVLGDRDPGLEDVRSLRYTRMVLEEALRLYPPAWVFERQTTAPDTLGGFAVAEGSIVGICPYVLHRHPDLWDNPEGFDPTRFSEERVANRGKYTYLPFGGGARTCIGNAFAMMEAQIILAMIVREHSLSLDPGHAVVPEPSITLRPAGGVLVRRSRASSPAAKASAEYQAPRTPTAPRAATS